MRRTAGRGIAIVIPLVALALAAWAVVRTSGGGSIMAPAPTPSGSGTAQLRHFFGVSVPAPMAENLRAFDAEVGAKPGIVESYVRFGSSFADSPADAIEAGGSIPLLQWNPTTVRLQAIADGQYDRYLEAYAKSIRHFRARIVISFGHEMNGPWWPWGRKYQSAASYVAAWRHIHDIFKAAGDGNVIWCWNPSVISGPQVPSPANWWPGSQYVNWVGLDGYYWRPGSTFATIFGSTVRSMHKLAPGKPVVITETGAYPDSHMGPEIMNLFAGAASAGLLGVVYFDHNGHSDWRIKQGSPAATAFQKAIGKYVQSR